MACRYDDIPEAIYELESKVSEVILSAIDSNLRVLIFLPAFNEEEAIGNVLSEITTIHPKFDLLVIDDGSLDRTSEIAKRFTKNVITFPFNCGLPTVLNSGLDFALQHGYDLVVTCDSDGQHPPNEIHRLIEASEGFDYTIGARSNSNYQWSLSRKMARKILRKFLIYRCKRSFDDPTSGFRVFRKDAIRRLRIQGEYFLADSIGLLIRAADMSLSVKEVEVVMKLRQKGKSSFKSSLMGIYFLLVILANFRKPKIDN